MTPLWEMETQRNAARVRNLKALGRLVFPLVGYEEDSRCGNHTYYDEIRAVYVLPHYREYRMW